MVAGRSNSYGSQGWMTRFTTLRGPHHSKRAAIEPAPWLAKSHGLDDNSGHGDLGVAVWFASHFGAGQWKSKSSCTRGIQFRGGCSSTLVERAGDTVLYRGMTRRWFCSGAAVFQEASRFVPMSLSFLTSYPPWQFQPGASGQQTFGDYASVRYRQGKSVAQPTVSDGGAGPRGAIHGSGMLRLRNTVNVSL